MKVNVRRAAAFLPLLLLMLLSAVTCAAQVQGTTFVALESPSGSVIDQNGNVWISHSSTDGSAALIREYAPAGGAPIRTVTLTGYIGVHMDIDPSTGYIWGVDSFGRVVKINPANGQATLLFNMRTLQTDFCHIYDVASGTVDCFGGLISTGSASYGDLAFWTDEFDGSRYLFISGNSTAFAFITRVKLTNDTPSGARVLVSSRASSAPGSNQPRGVAAEHSGYVMTTLPLGSVGGTFDRVFVFYALFDLEGFLWPTRWNDGFVDSRGMTTDPAGGFYIATGSNGTQFCGGGGTGNGDVLYISPDFSSFLCYNLNQVLANSRDAAVSPFTNTLYVPVIDLDRVVQFPTLDICDYEVFPSDESFTSAAGTGSADVLANGACPWKATSNAAWITITEGSSGRGDGTVSYAVAANTSTSARAGTLTIAGKTLTVNQAGAPCTYSINPTSRSITTAATTGTIAVTSLAGCAWTAVSNNTAWLTVTAGASGSGSGSVSYSAVANTGPARTGTITIGGQTFTITQASGCTYSISSTSQSFTVAGGTGTVNVTTNNAACPWEAVSNVGWVTINSGATGTGGGTVGYTVSANNGPARTGTLTIAGKTFTVTQPSGCTFSIAPTSRTVTASAGTGTVNVTTAAGCTWTAASNNTAWLTITAGASGNGGGPVNYSFTANAAASIRTGTMNVAGQVFTLTQNSELRIDRLTLLAGRASGGQQLKLSGAFANLTTVSMGGVNANWSFSNGTTEISVTTPAHDAGAVSIDLSSTTGGNYSKPNAFAYLPTVFTDDTLVAGVTISKAQHVVELRQAVDALRAVTGLAPGVWTDPELSVNGFIRGVHIQELRSYLEEAAALLGYQKQSYTDPLLMGLFIKRIHIEELRARIRTIAGI